MDIYGSSNPVATNYVTAPVPNFPGMNPNAPLNKVTITSNPTGAVSSQIRVQFNCASSNFKFEQTLDRSASILDLKDTIKRMNINQGKEVTLQYNNVVRQDNETLSSIGYAQGSAIEITLSDADVVTVGNPNPFDLN